MDPTGERTRSHNTVDTLLWFAMIGCTVVSIVLLGLGWTDRSFNFCVLAFMFGQVQTNRWLRAAVKR